MAYENNLFKIDKIDVKYKQQVDKLNRLKKFDYGYNEEFDFVVISRDGQIDPNNVYNIQGLRIAIPKPPKDVAKNEDNTWFVHGYPKELDKIKNAFDWDAKPLSFKEEHIDYIIDTIKWRKEGYWFMNDKEKTYITGSHYMFCTWSHIDIGLPDYREANRLFWYFWEACKADYRSYGMCYLKNRRSGFSYMASSEIVNEATQTKNSRYGILSKTGPDAKLLFTDKVVRIVNNYPFFFKPIQSGSDKPKSEMVFDTPARKLTRNNMKVADTEEATGLNTSIDWKATGDYSYDGEKLKLLIQDESGKWEKPNNVITNHGVTRTCCRLGLDIVGKIMMGSTCGALNKGGEEFRKIYYGGDLREVKRDGNGQTPFGLYSFFIPMEWNYEGTFDKYGKSIFEAPSKPILRYKGNPENARHFIKKGALDYWKAEYEGRKDNPDSQNEYLRQYPKYEAHAFRDEAANSLFNLTKLHDQMESNRELDSDIHPIRGNFAWSNGVVDSTVEFHPHRHGRFHVTWIPKPHMQNAIERRQGVKMPANEHLGSFGCDPYDISQAGGQRGSNGALHGLTTHHFSAEAGAPVNTFFLEYIARPPEATIFFEDVLMACIFYGMPLLCENNKARLLYHFRQRGYRAYSMNRPDKQHSKLSHVEKEIGGIPMTGESVRQAHAGGIESWIERHTGTNDIGQCGQNILFERTLIDWSRFEYDNRTKYDATISSGLAIMANQKHMYMPNKQKEVKTMDLGFSRFDNTGNSSKIIDRDG